jgi:hypothetical protein
MSPRRILFASALAALSASGCGAVTPADLVASVEGTELTEQQFDEYAREVAGDDEATEVEGQLGRQVVGIFLGVELLRADLEALGATLPPSSEDLEGFTALQNDFQLMVQAWSSLPPETTVDEDVTALYEAGPEESGVVCVSHILVDTEEEAEEAAALLEDGTDFAELAGAVSIDTQSAAAGGSLGCYPTVDFTSQFIAEFVDAALAADVGIPTDPVASQFGWHIIQLAPIEQLDAATIGQLRLETFADRYEIVVDPRVGQWDPTQILVPTV